MSNKKNNSDKKFTEDYYKKKIQERFNKNNSLINNNNNQNNSKVIHQSNTSNNSTSNKKTYTRTNNTEEDIFDNDGNIKESEEKINFIDNIKESFNPILKNTKKIINNIVFIINKKVRNIFNNINSTLLIFIEKTVKILILLIKKISFLIDKEQKNDSIKNNFENKDSKKVIVGSFNDVMEKNIIFMDNNKVPLYKVKDMSFTNKEEKFIIERALFEIKSAIIEDDELLEDGIYEGFYISEILYNLDESDLKLYLGFIKSNFDIYSNKKYKISDNFILWLSLGSPIKYDD
ncbi:MAG: hypothetical protein U0457_01665 [Candidatus Sericytochromatia bacterium]